MYILTNRLVSLRENALPLPWYHRAPLGLMSGTPVHVALQPPNVRFGDLIVSIVDPENWPFVSEISASRPDEPGVLADVYDEAPPLNLVFAEAVTVDAGSRHDARLVLEPYYPLLEENERDVDEQVQKQIEELKDSLEDLGFEEPHSKPVYAEYIEPVWMDIASIRLGWVELDGLREAVEKQKAEVEDAESYDLETAVISADTERRILRYVFPRKGAVSVSVTHSDRPGAMGAIADALAGHKLNILSSLLRRGSAPARKAEVVLVVEPTDATDDPDEVESRARVALENLSYKLRVRVDVSKPIDAGEVLYPRRPHEIAVRPSTSLEAEIREIRGGVPEGKLPIFISRRFIDLSDRYSRKVVEELQEALEAHGCVALEAKPRGGADQPASDAVKARMWASQAAILLVVSTPADDLKFSHNLAHECGFMQGQGKPLLPLVDDDVRKSVTDHANLQGLQLTTFKKDSALNRGPNSIFAAVRQWVAAEFPSHFESLSS